MTKKHFNQIANDYRILLQDAERGGKGKDFKRGIWEAIFCFCRLASMINGNFDRQKFLNACKPLPLEVE